MWSFKCNHSSDITCESCFEFCTEKRFMRTISSIVKVCSFEKLDFVTHWTFKSFKRASHNWIVYIMISWYHDIRILSTKPRRGLLLLGLLFIGLLLIVRFSCLESSGIYNSTYFDSCIIEWNVELIKKLDTCIQTTPNRLYNTLPGILDCIIVRRVTIIQAVRIVVAMCII